MVPQLHQFTDPPMITNQAAIKTFWNGQLYLTVGENTDGTIFLIRMWWKPFVTFIWLGGALSEPAALPCRVGTLLLESGA